MKALADELAQVPKQRFGYRERVRIERSLFLVVKEVCRRHLGYDLHGLSEVHREELNHWMERKPCRMSLQNLVREAFELRVFVLALSSTNAYVRDDALSRASLTQRDAVVTLSRVLRSLVENVLEEEGEQTTPQCC
jgi:hypothetical protein